MIAPQKQSGAENFKTRLDAIFDCLDRLHQQSLHSPTEKLVEQIIQLYQEREQIYQEWEKSWSQPMPSITDISVSKLQTMQTMTPTEKVTPNLPAPVIPTTYTLEELKAIPKLDMYCPELQGKLFYSLDGRPKWASESKLPKSIIERYKLTPRQVDILEGKLIIAAQIEVPNRDDFYIESPMSSREACGYYWQTSNRYTFG